MLVPIGKDILTVQVRKDPYVANKHIAYVELDKGSKVIGLTFAVAKDVVSFARTEDVTWVAEYVGFTYDGFLKFVRECVGMGENVYKYALVNECKTITGKEVFYG